MSVDTSDLQLPERQIIDEDIPAEWEPGMVLLQLYEVRGLLGKGGMGRVYKVHHLRWGIDLAVKSPKATLLRRPEVLEIFERECETWVNLGLHPNIVTCFYVRRLGQIPRIFAEYVNGGSLLDWIRDRRLYSGGPKAALARICRIGIEMAWGLQYAQEQGIIHRDVKPGNIMMTGEGSAKVTDFGLAKAQATAGTIDMPGGDDDSTLVSRGGMTPAYCSPEQARREPATVQSDIWNWAVTMLHMIAGKVTWKGGARAASAFNQMMKEGVPNPDIPRIPENLAHVLGWCIQPRPEDRPPSFDRLWREVAAVRNTLTDTPFTARPPSPLTGHAEILNNRAISLLDLGKAEEAAALWNEALTAAPQHSESTYNFMLVRWRAGQVTDEHVLQSLEEVALAHRDEALPRQLQVHVHLERGDMRSAAKLLHEMAQTGGMDEDLAGPRAYTERHADAARRALGALEGHADRVTAVALSADGRMAVSGSEDNTLATWNVGAKGRGMVLEGHTRSVAALRLSRNESHVASGSHDRTARLWSLDSGECLRVLEGHGAGVLAVDLSRDMRRALTADASGELRLWDVENGICLKAWNPHQTAITAVALNRQGILGASGAETGAVALWNLQTGDAVRHLSAHTGPITTLRLLRNGKYVMSASGDGDIRLWDVEAGTCIHRLHGHSGAVHGAVMTRDGHFIVSAGADRTVRVWQANSGRCLCTLAAPTGDVRAVDVDGGGRLAVTGSSDGKLTVWRLAPASKVYFAPLVLCRAQQSETALEADQAFRAALKKAEEALDAGDAVAAAGLVRKARFEPQYRHRAEALEVWGSLYTRLPKRGAQGGWVTHRIAAHKGAINRVAVSPDGRLALSGGEDQSMRLLEVGTGRMVRAYESHTRPINSVEFMPDGHYGISGSYDNTWRLWDLQPGTCERVGDEGRSGSLDVVSLSPDGRFALSAGWDIKLWDVASGRVLGTYEGHQGEVVSLAWSSDGSSFVTGSTDETVLHWRIDTGDWLRSFPNQGGAVTALAMTVDGSQVLCGTSPLLGKAGEIRHWDLASGKLVQTMAGHDGAVTALAVTHDGVFAFSASRDGTLRLWNLLSGECLRTFRGHNAAVLTVALSPDGRYAVSGDASGALCIWMLDWELEDREPALWDPGARVYLQTFITLQTPYAGQIPLDREPTDKEIAKALARKGGPVWSDTDLDRLWHTLGCAGYGWLHPDGVMQQLQKMAARAKALSVVPARWLKRPGS